MSNPLVFGKANIPGIVAIEPNGDKVELFIQDDQGNVTSVFKPHRYWLLTHRKTPGAKELKGSLHYKWGKQFTDQSDFLKARRIYRDADVYSIYSASEAAMVKDGYCFFQGLNPKDVSILSTDLETTTLNPYDAEAKILLIATTFRDKQGMRRKLFRYDQYESQADMLLDYVAYVNKVNPSILTGHNIIPFDLYYMNGIAECENITLNLGRDGSALEFNQYESKFRLDGTRDLHYKKCSIYGRSIVDTYFLAIKFDVGKQMESYALKPMIKQLGLESPGRTFYDASTIRTNYTIPEEWEKIVKYCEDDADDAIKLWDKMGPLYFYMAPMIPKPFTDLILGASGSQLNALMVRAYLQDGHSIPKADEMTSFQGAYSWGRPGIYKNVWKVDCAAMYPSIIIGYNKYDKAKDPQAHLVTLTKYFKKVRLEYKKLAKDTGLEHYKNMDDAAKVILNSFYGFCGAQGLNFNSREVADFITSKGREILNTAIEWACGQKYEQLPGAVETVEDEE